MEISHLIFADDVMLFCRGDRNSIGCLFKGITLFSEISGLKPNPMKCQCFFGNVSADVIHFTTALTGFQHSFLPVKYLGLPLITSKLNAADCAPLVMRLCDRIDVWTCKFLSIAGRLQLLKSVLFGIQNYWSMYLFLPMKVLKKIKSVLANFLWSGHHSSSAMHKVSWEDCCRPKCEGGLGIRDPIEVNRAAIFFQLWRIIQPGTSSLWIRWFHCCLLRNKPFWTAPLPTHCPWGARKILNVRAAALSHLQYQVGSNSNFLLWHDPLVHNKSLIQLLGNSIYSIMDSDSFTVAGEVIANNCWVDFGNNHVLAIEARNLLATVTIHSSDKILWAGSHIIKSSTIFWSLHSARNGPPWIKYIWHQFHIPRCAIYLWLMLRNRLLTKVRMIQFNMQVDGNCILCHNSLESAQHLFLECSYTSTLLQALQWPISRNWNEIMEGNLFMGNGIQLEKNCTYLVYSVLVYFIWKERNACVHEDGRTRTQPCALVENIKRMVREKLFLYPSFKKAVRENINLMIRLY